MLDASGDRLLHAGEVAAILGVPKSWVYAETRAGRLPHVAIGRYRRYRRSALEAWIDQHESQSDETAVPRFVRSGTGQAAGAPRASDGIAR